MQNQIVAENQRSISLSRYRVRRQTSITSIGQMLIDHLPVFFPEKDVELYRQWLAGKPMSFLTSMFNLQADAIKRIVRRIEERIDVCFETHRVKALLEMKPISHYSEVRATDYLVQVDQALIKVATLRVDSIAKDKLQPILDNNAMTSEKHLVGRYSKPELPIQERSIRDLKFSARATNILAGAHIITIGQLCKLSIRDLHAMRGAGTTVINEIQMALSRVGLSLKRGGRN